MRAVRPLAAVGALAVSSVVVGFLAAAAALALVATDRSGSAEAAAWLGAAAAGAVALGVAAAAFAVARSIRASQGRAEKSATRLRSVDRRGIALTSAVSELEGRLVALDGHVAGVDRHVGDVDRRLAETEAGQRELRAALSAELGALSKRLVDEQLLERMLRTSALSVRASITKSAEHSFWRTQGLLSLYSSLEVERGLPPMRSWAVAPDLAAHLVDMVRDRSPRHVVETGSGVSTVLLALVIRRIGHGHVTALEHDPDYAEETQRLLASHGVEEFATVLHCPLETVVIGAEEFQWYDVDAASLAPIDLLLVDGPPQSVGPLSRFPAVPVLAGSLSPDCLVVLDDAARDDEETTAERWCSDFGLRRERPLQHERGTIVLARADDTGVGPVSGAE